MLPSPFCPAQNQEEKKKKKGIAFDFGKRRKRGEETMIA